MKCDIIIPIYNAYECVIECVESVLKYTDLKENRLILINDKSTDPKIAPLLAEYKKKHKEFIVLENEEGYYIYKVKYLKDKLKKDIINKEINQIRNIKGLRILGIGFVNPNGFVDKIEGISYINGNDLYNFLENDE